MCSWEQNLKVLFEESESRKLILFLFLLLKDCHSRLWMQPGRSWLQVSGSWRQNCQHSWTKTSYEKKKKTTTGQVPLRLTKRSTNTCLSSRVQTVCSKDIFHALCMSDKGILNALCLSDYKTEVLSWITCTDRLTTPLKKNKTCSLAGAICKTFCRLSKREPHALECLVKSA